MNKLYIVYGSETKLLENFYSNKDDFFIKIYNNRVPRSQKNSIDVNNFNDFKIEFEKIIHFNTPKKIIFIGAAFLVQNSLFISEKYDAINKMIEVNISNYISYAYFLIPHMIKVKSGNFIFLSSFRSQVNARGISIYSASKAFGEKFFEILGKEYGAMGIYSVSIRLGCFDGRMFDVIDEKKKKEYILSIGNRRLGSSKDLIKTINFIVENNYTNGGVIDLTGGISF